MLIFGFPFILFEMLSVHPSVKITFLEIVSKYRIETNIQADRVLKHRENHTKVFFYKEISLTSCASANIFAILSID